MRGNACSVSSFICACVLLCMCILSVCVRKSISVGRGNDDGWRAKEGLKQLCAVSVSVKVLRVSPLHFLCHTSVLWYDTGSKA